MMEYSGIGIIPLLIGILEVLKQIGLRDKLVPLTSLILGIVIGVSFISPVDIKAGIVQGIYIGLSAVGLYSGAKNILKNE